MKAVLLVLMGLFIATPADARQQPTVYVFSEEDEEIHRQCGINYAGLNAAVANTLRRSGYQIAPQVVGGVMYAYLNLILLKIEGGCAIYFRLQFYFVTNTDAPWRQKYFINNVICSQGRLFIGPTAEFQSRLRSSAIDFAEVCINEEEQKRR